MAESEDSVREIDPFTSEPAPALASLQRVPIGAPPTGLSWQGNIGRVGDRGALVTTARSQDFSHWITLDSEGAWGAQARLEHVATTEIVDCGGRAIVGGATHEAFVAYAVSPEGELEKRFGIDMTDAKLAPAAVCTQDSPRFVWVSRESGALVVASEETRHEVPLEHRTSSISAVAVGDRVAVLRVYHGEEMGQLDVLLVEDGEIVARRQVEGVQRAGHENLIARDGYLLAVWRQGKTMRAQVIGDDLGRATGVRVLHEGELRVGPLHVIESASGRIAAVWAETDPRGDIAPDHAKGSGRYAALVDPLGRKLGPPTSILSFAFQYFRVAWAGEHIVAYGAGRRSGIERYRVALPGPEAN